MISGKANSKSNEQHDKRDSQVQSQNYTNNVEPDKQDIMAKLEQESGIKLTEDNTEEAISPKETGFYDNSCMDTNKPSNKNKTSNTEHMINSPYVKDSSEVIFKNQNESFKQGKEVKKSKDSGHRINTPKGKDNTLVKRLSEDVDERNHMPFMKPKYKKPPTKKLNLHKKTKGNLNKNHPNDDQFTRKSNHLDNQQDNMYDSNLGPADDDALLEEQLNWINEMAREKYGSSEQIDEI